ncbi:MAG: methyltransferase domain-containing protein [Candidatus Saccharimonas sp.]
MTKHEDNGVARYYSRIGSWAGYNLVLGRSQHAGYWKDDTRSEKQAQHNYLEELAKLLKLKPDDKVLDAGSGQGYAARYLAETTGAQITGITITPREVVVSEKLSRKMKNPPKFVFGDYANTSFPDNHFDVVYVTETLSHAKDMQQTMREFHRILKPGGRVVLADYEVDTRRSIPKVKELYHFLRKYAGGYGISQQNPGEISTALEGAGFKQVTELDWSQFTKPTYDRLRRLAKPFSWIHPSSRLAPYFINAVMASHGYSNLYEMGMFRYLVYQATKEGRQHGR